MLEFSTADLISLFILIVSIVGLFVGTFRYMRSYIDKEFDVLHKRISIVEKNSVKKDEMDKTLGFIKASLEGVQAEQHRLADRFDQFVHWLIEGKGTSKNG